MKKHLFLLLVLLTTGSATLRAQVLGVFTWDNNGKYTNVRNAPKGKIVDRIPTDIPAMFAVEKPTNGWWKIFTNEYDTDDNQVTFKGSTKGYWIHYSVLAVGTRNYGGETLYLRKTPNAKGAVVYQFKDEIELRPVDITADGEWVKVKTVDGKFTGWIESDWLCDNSLTNCC